MKNLASTFICLLLAVPSQAGIIYVDANATGDMNGVNWANAYNYLQDALADANSNVDVNEIWVAQGIYTPDSNSADPNGSGVRTATFQLINGVGIYGGFPSGGDPNWNDREPNSYETILSGDLDVNDIDVNDPWDFLTEPTRAENSYHVLNGSGTDANAVIDGFTITAGNANGYPDNDTGGGMYIDTGDPTLANCTFINNSAEDSGAMIDINSSPTLTNCTFSSNYSFGPGGGIYNHDSSSPTLTNCTFSGNFVLWWAGGGMYNDWYSSPMLNNCTFSGNHSAFGPGGGMYNSESSPTLTNCTFSNNIATDEGGGMYNEAGSSPMLNNCTFSGNSAALGGGIHNDHRSSPIINNCTFSGNSAYDRGGAIRNIFSCSPTITNCTFSGNSADDGGAIFNYYDCTPTITNCTFVGNSARNGNALACDSYQQKYPSSIQLTNCILWDSGDEIWNNDDSNIAITYSNIQGRWPGIGNIDADPCFVDPCSDDYHLKSEGWRWDTQRKVWKWDDVTSRCIDAGNPGSPLGGEPLSVPDDPNNEWGQNLRINMGAYGGSAEASMPPHDWAILADLTNDGRVDSNDLAAFVDYWLDSGECILSDLNHDQFVNMLDFALLGQDWYLETSWYTP